MTYAQFTARVRQHGWDVPTLRSDNTPPTDDLLDLMDECGLAQYERFVLRYAAEHEVWFRQIHPTSWVAYRGNQAIWETTTRADLERWLKDHGITAAWRPLTLTRI